MVSYLTRTWARHRRPAAARRGPLDGIEAIELTSRAGSPTPETIWVSPITYLPVRVAGRSSTLAADITWLPVTTRNLAKLTVPIPAGFRQIPFGQFLIGAP